MSWYSLLKSTQYTTPTAGSTVTANSGVTELTLIIDPAGLLAALTIAMPSNPVDGQIVRMISTQIVTALTVTNATLGITLTSLAAGSNTVKVYNATQAKWY